jgi:histidinol-phosphate aminotransferase
MSEIVNLIRPSLQNLVKYSSAREEFEGEASVYLDANENPFGDYNRYPDPYQLALKKKIAEVKKVDQNRIFLGNGSDEIIDLLMRLFCVPGQDAILQFTPSYGMYEVSAKINDINVISCPLDEEFDIDIEAFKKIEKTNAKILFICSPNNPSGNSFSTERIQLCLEEFKGIIVIDEAYIDFSNKPSWIEKLKGNKRLVVVQTFSKAYGLASCRLGMAFADPEIVEWLNKIKPPYNISTANQNIVLETLQNHEEIARQIEILQKEKSRLLLGLKELKKVKKVYPSDANFLLIKIEGMDNVYDQLLAKGIVTRKRKNVSEDAMRISIGSEEENDKLLTELKKLDK